MTRCNFGRGSVVLATGTLAAGSAFTNPPSASRPLEMSLPTNFPEWTICEAVANKSGGKTAAVLGAKGEPICFTLPALRSPFDATSYNDPDATRVNLSLELGPDNQDIVDWCAALDSWVLQYCSKNCRRLFGKDCLIISELRPLYFSPLKSNEKYGTHLFKTKLNRGTGRHCVRIWNEGGLKREPPPDWAGLQVQSRVVLKSMWLQGSRSFGLTFECTDAMITGEESTADCPFAIDSD